MYPSRPKPSEIAAQIKTEYSPNSPAMRLTLVNYILSNNGDIATLDALLEFVSSGYEEFKAELDAIYVDSEEEETTIKGVDTVAEDFDPNRSPYL